MSHWVPTSLHFSRCSCFDTCCFLRRSCILSTCDCWFEVACWCCCKFAFNLSNYPANIKPIFTLSEVNGLHCSSRRQNQWIPLSIERLIWWVLCEEFIMFRYKWVDCLDTVFKLRSSFRISTSYRRQTTDSSDLTSLKFAGLAWWE